MKTDKGKAPTAPPSPEEEVVRLRRALRGCVEWMDSDYVRALHAYSCLNAPVQPTERDIELGRSVWEEARAALGPDPGGAGNKPEGAR